MTLRTAQITASGIIEGETLLDPRVCDCCPTATVLCPDGSVLVAYRDRSEEEVRDIAVTRYKGGAWSTPRVVHRDEWKIAGCPVNGPALAVSDSLVALAWFTMAGGVDPRYMWCSPTMAAKASARRCAWTRSTPKGEWTWPSLPTGEPW